MGTAVAVVVVKCIWDCVGDSPYRSFRNARERANQWTQGWVVRTLGPSFFFFFFFFFFDVPLESRRVDQSSSIKGRFLLVNISALGTNLAPPYAISEVPTKLTNIRYFQLARFYSISSYYCYARIVRPLRARF
jgi:hypothetical protein